MKIKKPVPLILLIDDNEDDNFIHKLVLEEIGAAERIDTCLNGEEALEYVKMRFPNHPNYKGDQEPSIIFLDINMPRMNGWEFLEEYAKLDNTLEKSLFIVMLTTSPNPEDAKVAKQSNLLNKFLNKPLVEENILKIFEEHFPNHLN